MHGDLALDDLAQRLGTRADELCVATVHVEHVGAGIDATQVAVAVEGVQLRRVRQAL